MLGYRSEKEDDYRQRFQVLESAGILVKPDPKKGSPLSIVNRAAFDELSFLFFVSWLYVSIWNRSKYKIRASWVLMPNTARTILSLAESRFPFVIPGTAVGGEFLDDTFYACNVDHTSKPEDRVRQKLCPVLNRVRLNIGNAAGPVDINKLPSSEHCCGSLKARFWEFLNSDLEATRSTASATIGGNAIPIQIDSKIAAKFATGLNATSNELGMVFEETLLLYALEAAGAPIGLPHFIFNQPTESHEIDFAIYDTQGHKKGAEWEKYIGKQSLCVFEVTCGHLADTSDMPGESKTVLLGGNDHPHKKLVNFLALRSLGFAELRFHYLSILPMPKEGISDATKRALANTDGFTYWCLGTDVPAIEQTVLRSLEGVVDLAQLRSWHRRIVEYVRACASEFASALQKPR